MERLQWNSLLDKYLTTGNMLSEEYEQLNKIQITIIQELKKSYKRLNKGEVDLIHHSLQNNG